MCHRCCLECTEYEPNCEINCEKIGVESFEKANDELYRLDTIGDFIRRQKKIIKNENLPKRK